MFYCDFTVNRVNSYSYSYSRVGVESLSAERAPVKKGDKKWVFYFPMKNFLMHLTFEPQPERKLENSELKPPKLKPPADLTLAGGTKAPAGKAETAAIPKIAKFENLIFFRFLSLLIFQKSSIFFNSIFESNFLVLLFGGGAEEDFIRRAGALI